MSNSIKLPASRKFTYADFKQDDDIAYMNCGSRYDIGIKFIVSEHHLYRVLKNNDKSETYSQPEYIIKTKYKERESSSKYDYQGTLEFTDVPSAKIITITNVESCNLNYCTQEELIMYINKNINLSLLIGRSVFVSTTVHCIDGNEVSIKCEHDASFDDFPICEITKDTQIVISENVNSSMKINNVVQLGACGVIDVIVKDCNTKTTKVHGELEKIMSMLQTLETTCKKMTGDTAQKDQKCVLKNVLCQHIKEQLMATRFKIGSQFSLNIDNNNFVVTIDGVNSRVTENVAFIVNNEIIHLNIQDNLREQSMLDAIYNLHETDNLIFNIVSSNLKVILRHDLIKEIKLQLENTTILKGHKITVYVGNEKINLIFDDIFVKSTNELDSLTKVAYTCDKICMPSITINDNTHAGIYITDSQQKYEISSICLRLLKRETISNFDLASLLKVTTITDINANNVRQHFKYKIKESCVFVGRTYEHMGIKYVVENLQYSDLNVNSKHRIVGTFTEHTDIKFNKDSQDKSINLIDTVDQTSRNLDIETIKGIAKQMEKDGLYGMTNHVDKFIKEVLLTRTNLVDENLIDLIEPTKGVILYGPPGTGKTTLARNIGKIFGAIGSRIRRITATEIKSKWHGESEDNIRKLFKRAIEEYELHGDNAPLHILIIDEIDAVLGTRGESISDVKDSIVNQFLGEIDGLVQFNNCIIIGITNRLELLDPACLRPGRFGCHIHVDLPSCEQRKLIFESFHRKLERANIIHHVDEFNYQLIAELTHGLSGADIKHIYQLATAEHINKKMNGIVYNVNHDTVNTILKTHYNITI